MQNCILTSRLAQRATVALGTAALPALPQGPAIDLK